MNQPAMKDVIAAKSDQLNSDDLMSGPITIEITRVDIKSGEQPVSIFYKGDNNKPWKPCKSMCRAIVQIWGPDASTYAGKRLTLYRDPSVTWGGMAVGGIRISNMSGIDEPRTMALTATRGSKKAFVVKPLGDDSKKALSADDIAALKTAGEEAAKGGGDKLKEWWKSIGGASQNAVGGAVYLDELKSIASRVVSHEPGIM